MMQKLNNQNDFGPRKETHEQLRFMLPIYTLYIQPYMMGI